MSTDGPRPDGEPPPEAPEVNGRSMGAVRKLSAAPSPARSARREGSPYPKASVLARVVGRLADVIVSLTLSSFAGVAGILAGLLYLLVADALGNGQSLGKRIAGVKVVHVPTRAPAALRESMIRNSPFALCYAFYAVPIVGWILLVVAGVPLLLFEAYMIYGDPLGVRIGDVFADSQVVDAKVVAGTPAVSTPLSGRGTA